jgi:hypothetical protein
MLLAAGTPLGFAGLSLDNVAGYYTFENGGADSATWASGGAYEGVLRAQGTSTGYSTAQTMFGTQSLYVTGGGFFSLGNPDKYRFGAGSFTITYWLYMPSPAPAGSSNDATLIGNKDWSGSGNNQGWVQALSGNASINDDIKANAASGGSRADATAIDMDPASQTGGGWTFVAMVVDRSSNLLWNYVADPWVLVSKGDFGASNDASEPTSASIAALSGINFDAPVGYNINIGQDGDGAGYTQLIAYFDDVALWNTALSREDLWEIYSRGRGGESLGDILLIPEPSTYAFAGIACTLAGLVALRRRKKASR